MSEIVILTKQQRLIIDPPTRTVAIVATGPAGPPGPVGPLGPTGPQGVPGSLYLARNRIINGGFDVWQRGGGPFTAQGYTADMVYLLPIGSTVSLSRQTFALGNAIPGYEPTFWLRTVVTSVAGAGNGVLVPFPIEGVRTFAGQVCTLSWFAKADAAKPMSIELEQIFGTGGSPSATVQTPIVKTNLTTAWARYSVTFTPPSIAGKTIGTANDRCSLNFWFDAGSNHNARTGTLGQQSGTFDIWGVQLEAGSSASAFEVKPVGDTLRDCQRYLQRHGGGQFQTFAIGHGNQTGMAVVHMPIPVAMRAMPEMTTAAMTQFRVSDAVNTAFAVTAIAINGGADAMQGYICLLASTAAGSLTLYRPYYLHANSDTTAFIQLSAEL